MQLIHGNASESMLELKSGLRQSTNRDSALSPTPPFPKHVYRLRLAGLVIPVLCASLIITSYMLVKGITFGVGFGFFGDPIISRGLAWLNSTFPHWQKLLELRK